MIVSKDFLFYFPQAGWLLLLLLPLCYAFFALNRYRQRQYSLYASAHHLSRLLLPRSSLLTTTKFIGWALIWVLTCVALMEPFGNRRYVPLASSSQIVISPHEIIFLVDTSASMLVPDSSDGQTRLEEAQVIMEDIMRQLRGQLVSLYAFTSELSAVVPSTLDYLFTRLAIKTLHVDEGDVGGTRLAPVLKALKEQAFPQPSAKRYTVILLTDGGDTQLEVLKGMARDQEKEEILKAISDPQHLHVRLFTVGLGSLKPHIIPHVTFEGKSVSSKLEPDILKQLAEQERGQFYIAQEMSDWDLARALFLKIEETDLRDLQAEQSERKLTTIPSEELLVDLYYQIPLGLALIFYVFNFLLPDVRRL